jgi:cell division protein FtsB
MAYPVSKSQYDFSLFEMKTPSASNVSTAPKKREEKKPQMRVVVNNRRKSKINNMVPASVRKNSVVKAGAVLFCLLTVLGMLIYLQAKLDNVNRQIARTQQTLEETKSETVRLQMEINSIISIDKVEDYAVNTLGMVKIESGQVEYIDLSGEDKVILSGNKTLKLDSENRPETNEDNKTSKKIQISEYGN